MNTLSCGMIKYLLISNYFSFLFSSLFGYSFSSGSSNEGLIESFNDSSSIRFVITSGSTPLILKVLYSLTIFL